MTDDKRGKGPGPDNQGWPDEVLRDGGDGMEVVHESSSVQAAGLFGDQQALDPAAGTAPDDFLDGVPKAKLGLEHGEHRAAVPGAPVGGGLKLPTPLAPPAGGAPSPAGAKNVGFAPPKALPDDLLKSLATPRFEPKKSKAPYVIVGLLAIGVGGGLYYMKQKEVAPVQAPPTVHGVVLVASTPPGARIWANGNETPWVTPHEIPSIEVDVPHEFTVKMAGFRTDPPTERVTISEFVPRGTASFVLRRARVLEIESEPPGAKVLLDGNEMPSLTPTKLPPLIVGEKVVVEVKKAGYVPARYDLDINAETATVTLARLSKAKVMDVVSDPQGAKVFVDGDYRGATPLYDLDVPGAARFVIKLEKPGFFTQSKRMTMGSRDKARVDVRLKEQPLVKMPLTNDERGRLRQLTRRLVQAKSALKKATGRFRRAQQLRNRIEATPEATIHERAKVETAFDIARGEREEAEDEIGILDEELINFKTEVMGRLEEAGLAKEAGLP